MSRFHRDCYWLQEIQDMQATLYSCSSCGNDIIDCCPEDCNYFIDKKTVEKIVRGERKKEGTWVYDPDGMDWNIGAWICSECGCKNDNLGMRPGVNPLYFAGGHYCPCCGSKMTDIRYKK